MPRRGCSGGLGAGGASSDGSAAGAAGGAGSGGGAAGANHHEKDKGHLSSVLKTIHILNANNFSDYLQSLRDAQFHWHWPPRLIGINQTAMAPWNFDETADTGEMKLMRRDAYTALKIQIDPALKHVLTGVEPGDVKK